MQDDDYNILSQMPGYVIWKNTESIYLGANSNFRKLIGLKMHDQIIGMTDFDMPWARTHAELYRKRDKEILTGVKQFNFIETQLLCNKRLIYVLVNKVPLYSKRNHIVGLICQYNELPFLPMSKLLTQRFNLSPRQAECLNYITLGFSAKQIAFEMNLSTRTIEFYTNLLKEKLNCSTKYELIRKALISDANLQNQS